MQSPQRTGLALLPLSFFGLSPGTAFGIPIPSRGRFEVASSIYVISVARKSTDDVGEVLESTSRVSVGLVAAIVLSCIAAAVLVGVMVDVVVRHITGEPEPNPSGETQTIPAASAVENNSIEDTFPRTGSSGSDSSDPSDPTTRGSSYYFDKEKGAWSMRGLSATGGASSVGHSLYAEIEDGCASSVLRKKASEKREATSNAVVEHADLGSSRASPWFRGSK